MVGIVVATHGEIGKALLETAIEIVGFTPIQVVAVSLEAEIDRAAGWDMIVQAVDAVDHGDGTLIMVDMFGGTPSNLAISIIAERKVEVLTGVNLAMVLRTILKRENQTLPKLASDVLAYGQRNVTSSAQWLNPSPITPMNEL